MARKSIELSPLALRGDTQKSRGTSPERWEELLQAAASVFYEKGYDAATLSEIADRVGLEKPSLYHYIKTKADLRATLIAQLHIASTEMIRERMIAPGNALAKMESMIRGHLEMANNNLIKVTVFLQELQKITSEERDRILGSQEYRRSFLQVFEQGQRDRVLVDSLDPQLSVDSILGTLNASYQWYGPGRNHPPGVVADHLVFTLLRAYATPEALEQWRTAWVQATPLGREPARSGVSRRLSTLRSSRTARRLRSQ